MRLEARPQVSRGWLISAPFVAVAVTLLLTALLLKWAGAPVGEAFSLLVQGAFGTRFALSETLTRATPLILTGLAAAVAFRARLFNIGAEGQLYLGALAAVAVGGQHPDGLWAPLAQLPLPVLQAVMVGAAALALNETSTGRAFAAAAAASEPACPAPTTITSYVGNMVQR